MPMFKLVCVLLILMAGTACGSSPLAPAPPANIAGAWTGTFQATRVAGGPYLLGIRVTLDQTGSAVSGTWATGEAGGAVAGTTSASRFDGMLTWNFTSTGCVGTFAVSGTVGPNTLIWTSPRVTGNCVDEPSSITITVERDRARGGTEASLLAQATEAPSLAMPSLLKFSTTSDTVERRKRRSTG